MKNNIALAIGAVIVSLTTSCNTSKTSPGATTDVPLLERTSTTDLLAYGPLQVWDDFLLGPKSNTGGVGGSGSRISLLQLHPAKVLWSGQSNIDSSSRVSVFRDLMAVGGAGTVQLYRKDGTLVRLFTFPGANSASYPEQIVLNAKQLAFTFDYTLYVYDLDAQGVPAEKPRWTFESVADKPSGKPHGLVADDAGNLYVGWYRETGFNLASFDPSGQFRWKTLDTVSATAVLKGSPLKLLLSGQQLFTVLEGGGIHLFDLAGKQIWRNDTALSRVCNGLAVHDVPVLSEDGVFENCYVGHGVVALNRADGTLRWEFQAPDKYSFGGTPLFHNGVVYSTNSRTWALDAQNGKVLAVSEESDPYAIDTNPVYYPPSDEIVVWGNRLDTYKPLR